MRFGDLSGQHIDERYTIVRKAGSGSMGDVYEATHHSTGRRVAVKVLKAERMHLEVFRKRFIREARSAAMVRHPNVVEVLEVGQIADGPVFFAMEYLEGDDLRAILKREHRLTWHRVHTILLRLTSALAAAHDRGVIHRDIKPANVLLVRGPNAEPDTVKLVDFGVAKLGMNMVTRDLTRNDDIVGTALYMSPEQAMGEPSDARSDVYALGIMAYELVTGTVPFPGDDIFSIMSAQLKQPPKRLTEIIPSLPETAEAIILRALEKKPGNRFQTMTEFHEALASMTVQPQPDPLDPSLASLLLDDAGFDELPTVQMSRGMSFPKDMPSAPPPTPFAPAWIPTTTDSQTDSRHTPSPLPPPQPRPSTLITRVPVVKGSSPSNTFFVVGQRVAGLFVVTVAIAAFAILIANC